MLSIDKSMGRESVLSRLKNQLQSNIGGVDADIPRRVTTRFKPNKHDNGTYAKSHYHQHEYIAAAD